MSLDVPKHLLRISGQGLTVYLGACSVAIAAFGGVWFCFCLGEKDEYEMIGDEESGRHRSSSKNKKDKSKKDKKGKKSKKGKSKVSYIEN